jgi:hypothetical protein
MTLTQCWSRVLGALHLLTFLIFSQAVFASEFVVLDHETVVYLRPTKQSQILQSLQPDEEVEIGSKAVRGFHRVALPNHKFGYISADDLPPSVDQLEVRQKDFAVGVTFVSGSTHQGAKQFNTADGTLYQTSGYDGTIVDPGIFLDYRIAPHTVMRTYLAYQSAKFTGMASNPQLPIAGQTVKLDETLINLGLEFKFDLFSSHHIWLGFGGDYAFGTTIKLTMDNNIIPTSSEDNPKQLTGFVAAGWDIDVAGPWMLCPELRYLSVLTSKPMAYGYEFGLGFGYRY